MRAFALLVAVLLFAPSAFAQAQAKPNTLTPKELADGWLLLFDGETTFGWAGRSSGVAMVQKVPIQARDGTLQLVADEGQQLHARHNCWWGTSLEIDFEYRVPAGTAELHFRSLGKTLKLNLTKQEDPSRWTRMQGRFQDSMVPNEKRLVHHLVVDGKKSEVSQSLIRGNSHAFLYENSLFLLEFALPEKSRLEIRNVKLRPLAAQPLFNGKDLDGWKVFPGDKYKSKFAVLDGAINVKDGPGDLQTVGKYKNFVLQLECISHGKHLNSGVFFRCRDGEYQNGYEAQIRNQFTPEATQDYVVEEYEPLTNKLLAKHKIKGTAVDYGTGAIYRRQPARKEMSKDGEWFAMTVSAQGNHFATWVNGVQVTDWSDHRPASDNARIGSCQNAGHLSIQGHDPTTNLSFRNLRVAETPWK
jgi:hypothetical protein